MTRRPASILAGTCLAILGSGSASWAAQGPAVCHPKAGGWVLIRPAQASSHIDESTGQPKHEHSGRVDVYATNGACPPLTPPTATPTGSTPSTATSTTPTTGTTTTTSTTSAPSQSTTSSTPIRPTGTKSQGARPTSASSSPQTVSTTSSTPTATSHPTSEPSSTGELARTGSDLSWWAVVGIFLAAVGGLVLAFYRRLGRGGRR